MKTLFVLLLCLLVSCGSNIIAKFPNKEKAVDVPIEKVDKLVTGNNALAWDIYKKISQDNSDKNVFFSPYSISTALAMTYAGAKNNTAKEMQEALHFPETEPHSTFSALVDQMETEQPEYKLSIANALWGQKGYDFLPEFLNTTGKNYGAGLYEVDFAEKSEEARQVINEWVEQKTQEKIQNLFAEGSLNPSIRLILTNAIYFKADWQNQFKKHETGTEDFHVSKTNTIKVPMMTQDKNPFFYYESENFQALRLPYKDSDFAMLIFLPKDVEGLAQLEKELNSEKITEINKKMVEHHNVVLHLPKFKAIYEFEVSSMLQSLGMKDAFDETKADFSGIAAKEKLFISKVIHKAFVNVDEKGTEAAAATAVIVSATLAEPDLTLFLATHPFLFTISHIKNNSILFMGHVVDPSK